MNNKSKSRQTVFPVLSSVEVRQRVVANAHKTGKEAFPLITMGVAFVQAALAA
jgi:hypothetical protein